jgi:signal transduction histidine kinase
VILVGGASVDVTERATTEERLSENGKLLFTISDNGIGFRSDRLLGGLASSALGLRGMQERALAVRGCVNIHSTPNKGTQVIVSMPAK